MRTLIDTADVLTIEIEPGDNGDRDALPALIAGLRSPTSAFLGPEIPGTVTA